MGINNYYFLTWEESEELDLAEAPDDAPLAFELIEEVKELNELPFELSLKKGVFVDYIPNSLV
ncbi:MAG: hypothetical protein A2W95_08195 [Bacteroidetes bacterium GWA2_40_14]|nr:MAG: hypothetical protein A2W95_08195 [Bacteroidetes bacterium GWA2_40_14]